jgi:16S rRNA (adenine1518-N6/adenine1519-N6)-dimethyltransferase
MKYTLKKSLGQHFLRDEQVCRRIIAAIGEDPVHRLLEVGPGGGALTKYLLQLSQVELKCVEVDSEKVEWLKNTFPLLEGRIIHQSFLDMQPPFEGAFSVVGNFPYNISSQILFRILEWKDLVPLVIGMFQKEVALRVVAPPGSKTYGVLSVLVQAYYQATYLFEVHEQCFQPPPKVKSAVIRLRRKAELPGYTSEADFFRLVKAAFNQRRKTIRNAVRPLFTPEVLADPLFDLRAEQLSIEQFAALTHKMSSPKLAP